jgi:hypothetical protein
MMKMLEQWQAELNPSEPEQRKQDEQRQSSKPEDKHSDRSPK